MLRWLKGRKVTASVVALSVLVAVPVTFAVLHEGFPVTDVDLSARDVWVTNGSELMAGRLNRQIEELNASVAAVSNDIDVLQNGENVLLHDRSASSVERIDSAFTTLIERADLPPNSTLSLGKTTLSILEPDSGELWVTPTADELRFSTIDTKPIAKLGADAQSVVSSEGTVFAVSPKKKKLYAYPVAGGEPKITDLPALTDYQLTAAGEQAVILDLAKNRLVTDADTAIELPDKALKIQQVSATGGEVVVATGSSLLRARLNDSTPQTIKANITNPVTKPGEVSSPVNLNGCAHGAWSGSSRYLAVCGEASPSRQDIEPLAEGAKLEFRVNRNVIALNNLQTGDVWLVDANMRLVKNWEEVTPPQEDDGEEGDEKASTQSFEDTLADRTEQNRPPIARDDVLGARPGKSTILPVLDNDTDPDGDVLTIGRNLQGLAPESGTVEFIDGGRALQFTPNPEQSAGTISFRYSVSDGRSGGVSEANVSVTIMPSEANGAPVEQRKGAVSVEAGQSITYNPLIDWRDPDGDDVFLQSAASDSGDLTRFSHEGFVTVTHTSGQLGPRDIVYVVSDGTETASGTFTVDVKAAGTLNPIGTPDHVETFVGEPVEAFPLENDLSTNGGQLALLGAEALTGGLSVTVKSDTNSLQVVSGKTGVYYIQYTVGAGAATSIGMLRVDVKDIPDKVQPPIAVHDTGYLRPNEPTVINVLTNDVSPSGKVLALRSLDIPDDARVLSIEVLNSSVVRVTSSAAVTEQLQFSYTVSDGVHETVSTVAIVPVPPLTKHQAPIASDDLVTVRAGDIASVPVLDNDIHPDSAVMTLSPDLAEPVQAGLAFVAGDRVRYQAPREPGVYTATYAVTDDFKQKDVAVVTFNVVAADKKVNAEPAPKTLVARVFADSSVTVNVPLDGLDPNGDSVIFNGLATAPTLGTVTKSTSTTFTYTAAPSSAGTDVFSYEVRDVYGATAVGVVRIGVIERPDQDSPPIAVDDTIEVQPGRVATVPVLGNDSDPNGYTIEVSKKLKDVPDGITAVVKNKRAVEIEAPDEETSFVVRYEITNGQGGFDTAFVQVRVTNDATIAPPTAKDHIIEPDQVVGEKTVDIDVTKGANNSGGRVSDLEISVEGPNAASAEKLDNGLVRVTLGDARTAVAYRLTNTTDDLSTAAFIVVPPFSDGLPPRIKLNLPTQYVDMNETRTWKLSSIAESPTGKKIHITGAGTVSSISSDGTKNFVDAQTLTFTPQKDYRGPASITFEASDGSSTGVAMLVLPITVGDPEMKDVAPTFTPPEITIEAGEAPETLDLRLSSDHPNPDVLAALSFSGLSPATGGIVAGLSGSTLSVSAPFGVQPGTASTLSFTVTYKKFTIPGTVHVRVVSSSQPLPSAVDDSYENGRSSTPVTLNVTGNDFNPFPDVPLKILDATVSNGANARVDISGPNLIITPGPEKTQQISIIYKIEDATGDKNRHVQGRADMMVTSAPDRPPAPTLAASPKNIAVTIGASPSSNGAEITSYTVTRTGGGETTVQKGQAGGVLNFAGVNGTTYSFTVYATNKVGDSEKSPSASATSYGQPGAPTNVTLSRDQRWANTTMTLTWTQPSDTGGSITSYNWKVTGAGNGSASGTSAKTNSVGAGTYNAGQVQACGAGGCGPWGQLTNSVVVENEPPPPPPSPKVSLNGNEDGMYHKFSVTDFPANTKLRVFCRGPQVSNGPNTWDWESFQARQGGSYTTNGNGNGSWTSGCYNEYKGEHWIEVIDPRTNKRVESNHMTWGL